MPLTGILSRSATPARLPWFRIPRSQPAWIDELESYRQLLQSGWTELTCHESFRKPTDSAGPTSRGQCGVSSAWLVEILAAKHVENLTYCYGNVHSAKQDGPIVLERHCWIEVGEKSDPSRLVVDLTGDQSEVLREHKVLHGPHDKLRKRPAVDYRAHTRLSPSELEDDLVYERLIILKQNLAEHAVAR